jgi:hypothetical protein
MYISYCFLFEDIMSNCKFKPGDKAIIVLNDINMIGKDPLRYCYNYKIVTIHKVFKRIYTYYNSIEENLIHIFWDDECLQPLKYLRFKKLKELL